MYNIELYNERHNYKAGESIEGTVEWRRDEEVESIEVRLFWFTKGKGTQDVGMVEVCRNFDLTQEPFGAE